MLIKDSVLFKPVTWGYVYTHVYLCSNEDIHLNTSRIVQGDYLFDWTVLEYAMYQIFNFSR